MLTASGGPFRGRSAAELADVTVEQALAHPTWAMGPVVTINSATLVNKGLELIEAHLLFDVPYADIDVVVHPQSIVHSMVTFADGATIAQASPPDMRLPIALALAWPDRLPVVQPALDWSAAQHAGSSRRWTTDAFPAVRLARQAGEAGGVVPALFNAANEEAVAAFLAGRLSFRGIVRPRRAYPGRRRRTSAPRRAWTTSWPRSSWAREHARAAIAGRGHPAEQPEPPEADLSTVLTIVGIVAFALGLLFSIGFHEFGHFTWARRFGMRVPQFMVGFGPTVFSRRRGETEYGVKAIPLGGYIRIVGMIPPAEEGESKRATRMRSFIAEVRGAALNDVLPTDGDRVFYAQALVAAGHRHVRRAVPQPGPRGRLLRRRPGAASARPCSPPRSRQVPACVLPAGARRTARTLLGPITSAGTTARSARRLRAAGAEPRGEGRAAARRHHRRRRRQAGRPDRRRQLDDGAGRHPQQPRPPAALTIERGRPAPRGHRHPDRQHRLRRRRRREQTRPPASSGVSPTQAFVRQSVTALPGYFGDDHRRSRWTSSSQIPQRIPQLFEAAFARRQARPERPDRRRRRRPDRRRGLRPARLTGLQKVSFLLSLLASVNLVLFLFNLLPLYPLDGGHIAGALYERVRGGVARVRGRPDPGPFDIARLMPVAYVVAGLFLVLSALLVVADIVNPVTLG